MCIDGASWRMAKFPVQRESSKKKKKNLLSLIPLIHVDVRENGTESSVKDARVQLTRENWPKETRYAKREPTPDRAAFESREGKRERAENGRREKGRRENEKELDGETNEEGEKERDIIRSWRQRWGEVKRRIRKGRRTEREEEKSRRIRVSRLVGTSYSFILKRPRKIASTVETVAFSFAHLNSGLYIRSIKKFVAFGLILFTG